MYNQDDFDRLMSDIIAGQMGTTSVCHGSAHCSPLDFSSHPCFNLNLFGNTPSPPALKTPPPPPPLSPETRIAQLAKQMAYERLMEEIGHPSPAKKSKASHSPSTPVLTESFHVNHLLNDVMSRILHEMFEKQRTPSAVAQPRASRKGELLFVKKQNVNNDEPFHRPGSKKLPKVALDLSRAKEMIFFAASQASESVLVELLVDIEQFI